VGALAELHVHDHHAWVIVVGTVDADRAHAVAELIAALARGRTLHRISIDLTCTLTPDRNASDVIAAAARAAGPGVDILTAGVFARIRPRRWRSAPTSARLEPACSRPGNRASA
jgi:hypothetical protein